MGTRVVGRLRLVACIVAVFWLLTSLSSSAAQAASPPFLAQVCSPGAEAGQCLIPRGIAVSPGGDSYVVDQSNKRVEQFTPWGEFVRAWGWGVLDGSSEFQICTDETGCQAGLSGGGAGQFTQLAQGIAVDAKGAVFVTDLTNHRVRSSTPRANSC